MVGIFELTEESRWMETYQTDCCCDHTRYCRLISTVSNYPSTDMANCKAKDSSTKDSQNLHWKSARFSRSVKSERVSRVVANSSACSIGEARTEKMMRAIMAIDLKIGAMFGRLDSKKRP